MRRDEFAEMRAFLEVAKQRSFTKAAARMGVTTSALSHTIKALEARLGVRVLARTTRDVAPTAAGERLRAGIEPHFAAIAAQVEALGDVSEQVSGHVRIVCTDDSVDTVFRPVLPGFLRDHPGVKVELMVDNGLSNIVESQFDAGVRFGESVAKDMVAVRIGPDVTYCIVGSPAYFSHRTAPTTPQDLVEHDCINYRLPTAGSVYAWELQDEGRDFSVKVEGQLILNNTGPVVQAALDGLGLAYVPRELVKGHLEAGTLRDVLLRWCPTFQGYHLYYPSRRHHSPAFSAFVEALRYREG
ncbi:LysR family transcriptional regulator [Sinorhizobium meliloti]|uniref:LysR family transcriptional regulator n=1 Tax=Rhizobium meliloti TaxID=382 RepID=UPI000FD9FCAF|nr:LysR family transcriptional regulator [Sinorhizobium meliloti]MDW9722535.1 LysR family transcriptional regulator [Sinorhizobium meliloti]MDW9730751.1 LysR family transcriptional regulator [Sinorhizobium meliloti]MDW9784875.1 LysR family transcriptional regulator [Sinorhizobium meliloti]RVG23539.1 LysR family transcriptional regulator [Sinorhizobium meliloti]